MAGLELVEKELWIRFKTDNDQEARDSLFLHYIPWVTAIARNVHRRTWAYPVDCEDFVQNATIGLLEAMSRYEPGRGIPFQCYAKPRVRGAVFNGLRAILSDRNGTKTDIRFAERLEDIHQAGEDSAFDGVVDSIVSLGIGYLLDQALPALGAHREMDGLAYAQASEAEAHLLTAVARLPERLRVVVQSHYFQHIPFNVLAAEWGLSKGRISQLHKSALFRLRQLLREIAHGSDQTPLTTSAGERSGTRITEVGENFLL